MQPYYSAFTSLSLATQARLLPEAIPLKKQPDTATDTAVICLHGFSGTPYEVALAIDAIAQRGMATYAPLLPGHGYRELAEQRQAFAKLSENDLLSAARQEIEQARQQYRYVNMIGFSMGGAIALTMAAEGRLDSCAVISPALRLPAKAEWLIPLLSGVPFTLKAPHEEPFYLPGYYFHHSYALHALWQVSRRARKQLPDIRCPVLGIHSQNDTVVPPIVLPLMQQRIPQPIQTHYFNDSGHVMLLDNSRDQVINQLINFFSTDA